MINFSTNLVARHTDFLTENGVENSKHHLDGFAEGSDNKKELTMKYIY